MPYLEVPQAKREAERIAAAEKAARIAAEKAAKAASLAAAARDAYTGGTIRAGAEVWEYAAGESHSLTCTAGRFNGLIQLWNPNVDQGTLCLFGDHNRTGTWHSCRVQAGRRRVSLAALVYVCVDAW